MVNRPRRFKSKSEKTPLRKQTQSVMAFKSHMGLMAFGAVCIATCAAAFSGNSHSVTSSTFVRQMQVNQQASPPALMKPLLVSKNNNRALTLLRMTGDQPDEDDQLEWKALIAAFQMYKAAYGDLRVPLRFIVPSMPPWPKLAWGMKLGHRVAAIRSTGKFIQNDESRRKTLEDMGFLWRLRTVSQDKSMKGITFQQIYDAVETYRNEVKKDSSEALTIPVTFVVPDSEPWPMTTRGLPLGKKISMMKGKTFLSKNPEVAKKLQEFGLELDAKTAVNDSRFQKVFDALKRYKELNGDLLVPQPFVVPDNSEAWPESTWGLRLGARVNAIRSQGTFVNKNPARRQMLDDIEFVWTPPPTERGRKRGRKKKEEIEAENAQFAETGAPPSADSTIAAMDNLFGPSFDFGNQNEGSSSRDDSKWGLDGEPMIDQTIQEEAAPADGEYVEPRNLADTLKAATERAVEAGILEDMTDDPRRRKGKQYKNIPLYNDDFGEAFVFDDVVEALTVYKKMYGDFSNFTRENTDFIIPASESNAFGQEEATAFDTAASARAAAAIAAYEEDGRTSDSEDLIAAEIKRLQEEVETPFATQTAVAKSATVSSDITWPEHLSGMQLGYIVKRIRDGSLEVKHLPERKATLDAIKFDWGDDKYFLNIPFEKAMCAFYGYYMVRGDMFVWDDFVMPDEDPWPIALAGYEVGKAVKQVRELQNFIEAYHPDKVQMLRMIEFVWFPALAMPLDPTVGGPTVEQRICESYGHPNYFELPEMPPTLIEKIFESGPVLDTDDPKQWYKRYYDWDYVKDLWYDIGCRDRAFALERTGYPLLAAEHAEKYGTGYYDELLLLLDELENLTKEHGNLSNLDESLKSEYTEALLEWRENIIGTCDFGSDELTEIDESIDDYLANFMNEAEDNLDEEAAVLEAQPDDASEDDGVVEELVDDTEYEYVDVEETAVGADDDAEYEYEYEYVEEEEPAAEAAEVPVAEVEEIDVEDELGLGTK